MYSIYSTDYAEQDVSIYNCYVGEDEWRRITNDIPTTRMFGRILNEDKSWIVALGQPIRSSIEDPKAIFVPNWMLQQIDILGVGDYYEIQWMPADVFDISEHIVLKSNDVAYQCHDIQEQLSNELTKLGILQKNTEIHVMLPSLDNYVITFQIVNLSPASVVLCQGDEVSLEFEVETIRQPTPIPPAPDMLLPDVIRPIPSAPFPSQQFNPWRNKDFKPNVS